jgi:acyl carrier protein
MNEFLKNIADVLEVEKLNETDKMNDFPQWDSLSVLSTIALIGSNYGINLTAAELRAAETAGDIWALVQSRQMKR